jgi:hypothetical protein
MRTFPLILNAVSKQGAPIRLGILPIHLHRLSDLDDGKGRQGFFITKMVQCSLPESKPRKNMPVVPNECFLTQI